MGVCTRCALALAMGAAWSSLAAAQDVAIQLLPMRPLEGERAFVSVVVDVAPTALPAATAPLGFAEAEPVKVEMVVHAFDTAGGVLDSATETVTLEPPPDGSSRGLKWMSALHLPGGATEIRVLVRGLDGAELASGTHAITIPERPTLVPPMVPEQGDDWTVAHGRRPDLDAVAPPAPFVIRDQPFVPSARPRLGPGQGLPVVLMGYGLLGHEADVGAEVVAGDGRVVPGTQLVISPAESGRDGLDRTLGVLYLPSMPEGGYTLRVFAEIDGATPTVEKSFTVTMTSAPSHLLRIVAPQVPPPVVPSYDPAAVAAAAVEAVPVQELVDGYRRILSRLDEIDRESAIAALARFEVEAVGESPEDRIPRLKKSQIKVLRDLAKGDREALVPALALHHDACLAHRAGHQTWLAHHGIDMAQEIAAMYAPSGSSQGSRLVAAQALASLGGYLQATGSRSGLALFHAALEYDPDHAAALLGLAADPEKRGGPYVEAIQYLERLVDAHPEDREARLRLAINRLRLDIRDETASAQAILRGVLDGPEGDWIYVLAAQELARSLAAGNRFDQALTVLRKARARVPDAQKLGIQLAYLLDRAGRGPDAQAVLASLRVDRSGIAPARGRYNQWPSQALLLDRAALAEGAERRREILARVAQAGFEGGL